MSALSPRWRPMRTAPKDGSYILLAYPSFSDSGEIFVGHARWTAEPHYEIVQAFNRDTRLGDEHSPAVYPVGESHWEVAYVSVRQHGGPFYNGLSYSAASATVREPIGWMPVPESPKARKSRRKQLDSETVPA